MSFIYLDHNVARAMGRVLDTLGHDTIAADRSAGAGATDGAHLLAAAQLGRVFVTYNVADFLLLHDAWHRWLEAYLPPPIPLHAGIVIVPAPAPLRRFWLPDFAARETDDLLRRTPSLIGQLHHFTVSRGWTRH